MRDERDHARGWMRKAENDLTAGRRLLEADGPFDTVCFHAQQAAERCLKAVLALKAETIPCIHNLEELQDRCLRLVPDSSLADLDLANLTPYATRLRYDFDFWPERETAQQALELAEKVRDAVLAILPKEAHP